MVDFIDLIKRALEEQGKSFDDLFRDNVISKNTFYKYRQRQPNLETVFRLANYLKISLDYLFEFCENNTFKEPYCYQQNNFYNNLIALLNARGISNRQFCKNLNYSRDNILRWKKGVVPSLNSLIDIANYFDCTLDDLLL